MLVDELRAGKAAIRSAMRALRDAIPPAERARMAGRIEARLWEHPAVRDAGVVLVYRSFGSEVPTERIAGRLSAERRRVLIPFLAGAEMEASALAPGGALVPTTYGPMEPADPLPVDPREVDLVLAPGLAFDHQGYRVGFGGGYFDRYLARLREDATRIGLAFHAQIHPALPHGPADQRMDAVITDAETVICPGRRPRP